MTGVWLLVAGVGLATVGIKALGPVLLGGRRLPGRIQEVLRLLGPALLAALVVTQVFGADRGLVVDARLAGLAAASVALVLRAPILGVVIAAAVVTALVRLA